MEFQDSIIDIPAHPRGLGENDLLGVQRSLEASTDVHSVGLNIARDDRLSPKRESAAADVPLDRAFHRDVSDAFQVTRHLSVRVDKRMLHLARRGLRRAFAFRGRLGRRLGGFLGRMSPLASDNQLAQPLSNATRLTEQLQREAVEKHATTQSESIMGD